MPRITSLTQADQDALFLEFVQEIHAGFPSPAADCAGERIDIARELTSHPDTTFYARVSGDSMHDAGLFDGDIIIAAVDGEFTVKEFRRDDDNKGGWLIPHNPAFQPIRVTAENNFSVWGVVTHCIHKTRRF